MAELEVRAASADEVRSIQARRRVDDLTMRVSLGAAERGSAFAAFDAGETVGVCVAWDGDGERYAGDVFVEPSFRGQNVGGRLIDAAFAEAEDRDRAVLLPAGDAAALAIALRRGIWPASTLLRLSGPIPREEVLMKLAAGDYRFEVGPLEPARHSSAVDALDREVRGTARASDHERFVHEATGQAFFLSGEMVAYAYVWPDGRVGPMAVSSASYLVQMYGFVLVTLQRTYGASWCHSLVPATNVRVARAALRAGLRIEESFTYACDNNARDLGRYVGYSPILF